MTAPGGKMVYKNQVSLTIVAISKDWKNLYRNIPWNILDIYLEYTSYRQNIKSLIKNDKFLKLFFY